MSYNSKISKKSNDLTVNMRVSLKHDNYFRCKKTKRIAKSDNKTKPCEDKEVKHITKSVASEASAFEINLNEGGSEKYIPRDYVREDLQIGIIDKIFKYELIGKIRMLRLNAEFKDYDMLNTINPTWFFCALSNLINHDHICLDDQSFESMKYVLLELLKVNTENCDDFIMPFVKHLSTGVNTIGFEIDFAFLAAYKPPMYKK